MKSAPLTRIRLSESPQIAVVTMANSPLEADCGGPLVFGQHGDQDKQ